MNIKGMFINLEDFKKRMVEADKKYSINAPRFTNSFLSDDPKIDRIVKGVMKTFDSMSKKNNIPAVSNYMEELNKTMGDYSKRKKSILNKVAYESVFVSDFIKKNMASPNLKYSMLGIYNEIWETLNNKNFIDAVEKAYAHCKKVGSQNTTASLLCAMYTSLAFTLELSTIYLMEYEYAISVGSDPEYEIVQLMKKHAGFTKNVLYNVIDIVYFVKYVKGLPTIVSNIIANEKKSTEILSVTVTVAVIVGLLGLVPALRFIVYFIATKKVDLGKYFDEESEFIENNIFVMTEKMNSTTDVEEKARLAKIIEKQKDWYDKFKSFSDKLYRREIEASYETSELIDSDDTASTGQNDTEIVL